MEEVSITKDIVEKYYSSIRSCVECNSLELKTFVETYPNQYKLLSSIHRRRSKINNCIKALRIIKRDVYWGTLTFKNSKDKNLVTTKRKEAFTKLNKLFDYFLLVEEYGGKNNRYHIHFVGSLKLGCERKDMFNNDIWSSRRDIQIVNEHKNLGSYLVKYLSKDLPRIRSNKNMVSLLKAYKRGVLFDNLHFYSIGKEYQCGVVNAVTIFDLES